MARPQRFTDDHMLEVAREVFLEQGPGVSTMVIAERIGVSQAALFKRFGSKEELMFRALAPPPMVEDWLEGIDEVEGSVADQLRVVVPRIASFFREMTPRFSVLRACGLNVHDLVCRFDTPPPIVAVNGLAAWFTALQAQNRIRTDLDPVNLAIMVLGPVQTQSHIGHLTGHPVGTDQLVDQLIVLVTEGLLQEQN